MAGKAIRIVSGDRQVSIAPHWRGRSGAVCPMRVGVRKDGGQRTERFAGEEFGQKRAIPKCAPSEIVSSCSRPDSRKEPPLFFSRKVARCDPSL